jgi:hypothetical protein
MMEVVEEEKEASKGKGSEGGKTPRNHRICGLCNVAIIVASLQFRHF